jgi:hypothetical protein
VKPQLKPLLIFFAVAGVAISSCSSNAPAISQSSPTVTPKTKLPTATFTFVPEPTNTSTATNSKTRINLSPQLYLDENSSPDNLRGKTYDNLSNFMNREGIGFIYHFGNEEWVGAVSWTRVLPFADSGVTPEPSEGLRQSYMQVWRDGKMLYSFPVDGICCRAKTLLRYEDHWLFWFMDDWGNRGWVVQDGILLNDLYDYDNAFSIFLLDGKPFFFFQRGDQVGVSFNGEEILLPYAKISYGPICCETGGTGQWNPRGTDIMVGFYILRGESERQYIEIGLR